MPPEAPEALDVAVALHGEEVQQVEVERHAEADGREADGEVVDVGGLSIGTSFLLDARKDDGAPTEVDPEAIFVEATLAAH